MRPRRTVRYMRRIQPSRVPAGHVSASEEELASLIATGGRKADTRCAERCASEPCGGAHRRPRQALEPLSAAAHRRASRSQVRRADLCVWIDARGADSGPLFAAWSVISERELVAEVTQALLGVDGRFFSAEGDAVSGPRRCRCMPARAGAEPSVPPQFEVRSRVALAHLSTDCLRSVAQGKLAQRGARGARGPLGRATLRSVPSASVKEAAAGALYTAVWLGLRCAWLRAERRVGRHLDPRGSARCLQVGAVVCTGANDRA